MQETTKLVGNGIDTLILNVRYTDEDSMPVQRELDEGLQAIVQEYEERCFSLYSHGIQSLW